MSSPSSPASRAGPIAAGDPRLGLRVLAAEVEVAARRARGERGDGHRLDRGERVALEEDAVLECPGLGFVRVADEVVRLGGLGRDGGPLAAGRERGTAATHQLGRGHLRDDRVGPDRDGPLEGRVPAVRPVVVERGRVDHADPGEQVGPIGGGLWEIGSPPGGRSRAAGGLEPGDDPDRVDRRDRVGVGGLARRREHDRRRVVAQAQAGAAQPRRAAVPDRLIGGPDGACQVGADVLRAGQPAGDVVADVGDQRWPRSRGEQGVEGRDAVGLGRRDRQALADVVECRRADPADPRLDRVECRQELAASRPDRMPAAGCVPLRPGVTGPTDPARLGWAEHGIHRGALGRRGERADDVQIHQRESSDRPRTRRCRPGMPACRPRAL